MGWKPSYGNVLWKNDDSERSAIPSCNNMPRNCKVFSTYYLWRESIINLFIAENTAKYIQLYCCYNENKIRCSSAILWAVREGVNIHEYKKSYIIQYHGYFRFKLGAAQFQICDSFIANNVSLGDNFTDGTIFDLIREVYCWSCLSVRNCICYFERSLQIFPKHWQHAHFELTRFVVMLTFKRWWLTTVFALLLMLWPQT